MTTQKKEIIQSKLSKEQVIEVAKNWMSKGVLKPDDLNESKVLHCQLYHVPYRVVKASTITEYEGVRDGKGKKGSLHRDYEWFVSATDEKEFEVSEYEVKRDEEKSGNIQGELVKVSVDEEQSRMNVKEKLDAQCKQLLKDEVDSFEYCDTTVNVTSMELVYVPFWKFVYNYKQKNFTVILEGVKGDVLRGDLPEAPGLPLSMMVAIGGGIIVLGIISLIALGVIALALMP